MCLTSKAARAPTSISPQNQEDKRTLVSGQQCPLEATPDGARGALPDRKTLSSRAAARLRIPFRIVAAKNGSGTRASAAGSDGGAPAQSIHALGHAFLQGRGGLHRQGHRRFLLMEQQPCVRLYVTPIQIAPEAPALPIRIRPSTRSTWPNGGVIRNAGSCRGHVGAE